jgi:peptidoglycan/xylan/chitin deacetylase (PgdA/CDA1 family)
VQITSRRRVAAVAVAACLVVALLASGWVVAHSGTPAPSAASPTPSASLAVSPVVSPTPSVTPTPTPTATPTRTPPPVYPVVDSCDPSGVPGAIPVPGTGSGKSGAFTLHVPILEYHRIVPVAEAGDSLPGLVVPPTRFSAQLDALENAGWHTITLAALADDLAVHRNPPARSFVITIDDGWEDGYTYARPILDHHGYVATYFVIAGRIDRPGFLTTSELQALVADGDEIGDHTMEHVSLSQQKGTLLTYEIDAAAARIAQVTGVWPESLAYPYGGVNARAEAAVAACRELRIAVVEEETAPEKAVAGSSPGSSAKPVAVKTAPPRRLVSLETWANRFAVPRIEVQPSMTPTKLADLLPVLAAG